MKSALILGLASAAACCCLAADPAPSPGPLRADHPMLGAWTYTGRNGCVETWRIDRGGTSLVTSADEVAEMRFALTDRPSGRGYYKWVDTLYKDNGKKDCAGQITKPPRTTTNYILMNAARTRFIFCSAEAGRRCFGPFVKMEGGEI
ncbi:MAG: hypothetical protein ABW032_12480 [Burkholderiaceae bacterium]